VYNGRVFNSAIIILKTLNWFIINSISLRTDTTFENFCNINACDVKYDGNCISRLAFVRGTLFDPASGPVVYRDVTRQAKGLHRLKYIGALESGLAHLSRCNSGWFCHTEIPNSSRHCSQWGRGTGTAAPFCVVAPPTACVMNRFAVIFLFKTRTHLICLDGSLLEQFDVN
jgi:hypothetical protein